MTPVYNIFTAPDDFVRPGYRVAIAPLKYPTSPSLRRFTVVGMYPPEGLSRNNVSSLTVTVLTGPVRLYLKGRGEDGDVTITLDKGDEIEVSVHIMHTWEQIEDKEPVLLIAAFPPFTDEQHEVVL